MAKKEAKPKKAGLVYILEILRSAADAESGLDQSEIIERLNLRYGISLNRETVGKNLDILLELYPDNIVYRTNNAKKRCGWRWQESRTTDFDPSEVRLLLGVVECYGKLDARHKQSLLDRIAKLADEVEPDILPARLDKPTRRNDTYRLFYNIGTLGEAIAKGKPISFSKGIYTKDGRIVRAEGDHARSYAVMPQAIAFKNNTYMLISSYGPSDNRRIMHSAIDTMFDVAILEPEEKADDNASVPLDIQKYLDEHLYMYGEEPQKTVIRIRNTPTCIRQMYEQFGLAIKSVQACEDDSHIDFIVREPEQPMVFWALQFCDMAEVLEPASLRMKIAEQVEILKERYYV